MPGTRMGITSSQLGRCDLTQSNGLEVNDCLGDAELCNRLLDLARPVNLMDDLRAHDDLGRRGLAISAR